MKKNFMTKSVILSSSGLKNIITDIYDDKDFCFIFGQQKIYMNKIFAEFISSKVSRIRKTDQTINSISISELIQAKSGSFEQQCGDIFSDDIISLFQQISSGFTIDITEDQSFKMRFLSIIIGNDELFSKINEAYPPDFTQSNINFYLQHIQFYFAISPYIESFDFSSIIDHLSSNFNSLDSSLLMNLPKSIVYLLISNKHLQIDDEDSLLDFIDTFFIENQTDQKFNEKDDEIDIYSFYELIEFSLLSEERFKKFLNSFDINQITQQIWQNFQKCFFNAKKTKKKTKKVINKIENFDYDNNKENSFKGIFNYLAEESGGNAFLNRTILITSSTNLQEKVLGSVINYNDTKDIYCYQSNGENDSWLKFDFKDRKVRPTYYSIRSSDYDSYNLPRNWVLEGSNTDDNWKILDNRKNDKSLTSSSAIITFKIQEDLEEDEFYRYIRIRQTGMNDCHLYFFKFRSFELFGSLA